MAALHRAFTPARLGAYAVLGLAAIAAPSLAAEADGEARMAHARQTQQNERWIAPDGTDLGWARFGDPPKPGSRGVALLPGSAESTNQYLFMVGSLLQRGLGPVYVLDFLGQGRSAPGGAPRSLRASDSEPSVRHLIGWIEGPVADDLRAGGADARPLAIGHSVGAMALELALQERPDLVPRAVQLAPPLDIRFRPSWLNAADDLPVRVLARILCFVGCEDLVSFPHPSAASRRSPVSSSAVRQRATELDRTDGVADVQGVTAGWLAGLLQAGERLRQRPRASGAATLILVGKRDHVVAPEAILAYACASSGACSARVIGGTHALHQPSGVDGPALFDAIVEHLLGLSPQATDESRLFACPQAVGAR